MAQLLSMTDDKSKQKAIEEAANIFGIDSIAADLKEQTLTVTGEMDTTDLAKRLDIFRVEIVSIGPVQDVTWHHPYY